MTQLGKYDSDRDNILHYMIGSGWSNEQFGDVESPTGHVSRISNTWDEVKPENTEVTSLIEDQLEAYDIQDSPEFRASLVGHFLVREDSNGLVYVESYPTEAGLLEDFSTLQGEYDAWDNQDMEDMLEQHAAEVKAKHGDNWKNVIGTEQE